jgi:hypothetical protein
MQWNMEGAGPTIQDAWKQINKKNLNLIAFCV